MTMVGMAVMVGMAAVVDVLPLVIIYRLLAWLSW
jgi:hypothetical protein